MGVDGDEEETINETIRGNGTVMRRVQRVERGVWDVKF